MPNHEIVPLTLETVPPTNVLYFLPRPQSVYSDSDACSFVGSIGVMLFHFPPAAAPSDLLIPQSQAAKKWIPFLFRGRDRKKHGLLCAPLLFAGGTMQY